MLLTHECFHTGKLIWVPRRWTGRYDLLLTMHRLGLLITLISFW
jgi:hypothetical protein